MSDLTGKEAVYVRAMTGPLTVDEHTAFVRTVIYHQRKTSGDDGCTHPGCELRVGESFAEHLWERFNELRPIAPDKTEGESA